MNFLYNIDLLLSLCFVYSYMVIYIYTLWNDEYGNCYYIFLIQFNLEIKQNLNNNILKNELLSIFYCLKFSFVCFSFFMQYNGIIEIYCFRGGSFDLIDWERKRGIFALVSPII